MILSKYLSLTHLGILKLLDPLTLIILYMVVYIFDVTYSILTDLKSNKWNGTHCKTGEMIPFYNRVSSMAIALAAVGEIDCPFIKASVIDSTVYTTCYHPFPFFCAHCSVRETVPTNISL